MTIRKKLILAIALILSSVAFLGFAYYKTLEAVGNRLTLVESIDDLGVTISDMRRAEKNYFLYRDETSAGEWMDQIELTRKVILDKGVELKALKGEKSQKELMENFSVYAGLARKYSSTEDIETEATRIRDQGNTIYEYSRRIILSERSRINKMTRSSNRIFLVSLFVVICAGVVGAVIIAREIVSPLTKIELATREVLLPYPRNKYTRRDR